MYYTYTIYYRFRGVDRRADVHQYDTHRFVYLREDELIREFAGQIEFSNSGEMIDARQKPNPDAAELYRAIAKQFQPIDGG